MRKRFASDGLNDIHKRSEELEELETKLLAAWNEFAAIGPLQFTEQMCKSVLLEPSDKDYPFTFLRNDSQGDRFEKHRKRFAYIAGFLLRQINKELQLPKTGFLSLQQYIEAEARIQLNWLERIESSVLVDLWFEFFDQFQAPLSWAVGDASRLIHQGVPVFRRSLDGCDYVLLDEDAPLYSYLCLRGKWSDAIESLQLPGWVSGLYFRAEDIEWHRRIFHSYETDDPQEEDRLREALRRQIGISDAGIASTVSLVSEWPWGSHSTGLLRQLSAAGQKFWKNYDPSDPTTAPKNSDVIDWLVGRGVAKRNAEVIATMLRDEAVPTGPRT